MLEDTTATLNPQTYTILVGVIQFALCQVLVSLGPGVDLSGVQPRRA
jgi:hypothetical protein